MENKHTRSVSLIDGHTEEMTDAEVKKALECCVKDDGTNFDCNNCKYCLDTYFCARDKLWKDTLDLINRLQAKNKELDEKLIIQKGLIDTQKAEIELLQKTKQLIKSEAIKEFWKRFDKVLCENIGPSKRVYWKISSDGNNLVKEMTEVQE